MSEKAGALAAEVPSARAADDALHDAPVGTFWFTVKLWLARLVLLAVLLGAWEWASGTIIDPFWVSAPS